MKKRKDGLYQSQITITQDGVKKQKYFYGKTQSEVRKKMMLYEQEKTKGRFFEEVADEWQEEHEKEIQYYTTGCYKAPLKDVKEAFKGAIITDITPQDVQRFIVTYAKGNRAHQTVKLRLIVLRQVFKFAIINGYTKENPSEYIQVPKGLTQSRRDTAPDVSIRQIQSNVDKPNGLLPFFLLYTGCRRSEALAVRYEDIDFQANLIHINKKIEFHGEIPHLVERTKTEKSVRSIILLDKLKEKLNPKGQGYLFQGKFGLYHRGELRKEWDKLGLNITQHQLRHAYVTMLFEAGIDPEIAMTQTGHLNIATMRDIYTHIRNEKLVQTAKILNDFNK